jgi:hypothetical protein
MPHGQWEQHQPVKSSPSTQIKRLFIQLYLFAVFLGFKLGHGGRKHSNGSSAEGELLPASGVFSTELAVGQSN